MLDKISELKNNSLNELVNIYHFRADTIISYKFAEDFIKSQSGVFTFTNTITDIKFSSDELIDKFKNYDNNYLSGLSFQHIINTFEVWFFDLIKIILLNRYLIGW